MSMPKKCLCLCKICEKNADIPNSVCQKERKQNKKAYSDKSDRKREDKKKKLTLINLKEKVRKKEEKKKQESLLI